MARCSKNAPESFVILEHDRVGEHCMVMRDRKNGIALVVADFDQQLAAGQKQRGSLVQKPADHVHAVRAASQGTGWFVQFDVRLEFIPLCVGYIGRVGADHVVALADRACGEWGSTVAQSKLNAIVNAMPSGIPASKFQRFRNDIGGDDARILDLRSKAHCDAAGSCADICNDEVGSFRSASPPLQNMLNERLRTWAGDQRRPIDFKRSAEEPCMAGQILSWFMLCCTRNEITESGQLCIASRAINFHIQPHPLTVQHMR